MLSCVNNFVFFLELTMLTIVIYSVCVVIIMGKYSISNDKLWSIEKYSPIHVSILIDEIIFLR